MSNIPHKALIFHASKNQNQNHDRDFCKNPTLTNVEICGTLAVLHVFVLVFFILLHLCMQVCHME